MTTPAVDFVDLVARFADIVGDTDADLDDDPDLAWIVSGTAEIAPISDNGYRIVPDGPMAGVRKVVLTFEPDGDGYARWQGKTFVRLVDLTSDKINPQVQPNEPTHRVEFRNLRTADGEEVRFSARNVRIAADTTELADDGTGTVRAICRLHRLLPLSAATPQPIFQGPQGTGVEGVDQDAAADGDLVLNLTDGSSTTPVPLPPGVIPNDAQLATALGQPQTKGALSAQTVQVYNVKTEAEANDAITKIVAAGAGILRVPTGATLTLSSGPLQLPNEVRELIIDGSIAVDGTFTAVRRTGTVSGPSTSITATIAAGQRTVTVNTASAGLAVGDWVMVVSADTLPGTTDKLGYIRQVRSMTSTSATFDSAFPRALPDSSRRLRKLTLAAPLMIRGAGDVYYLNPAGNTVSMVEVRYGADFTVSKPLRLHDGGGPAVSIEHTVGFEVNARIDNFIDDVANGHAGYGVNVRGASRDGRVGGVISRCRHAFTTNVGPSDAAFNFYGEPENITVEPITRFCTDKALDTHRAGWGLRMICRDQGSGGGLHIRADNVYGEAHVSGQYIGSAVWVEANLVAPPTIGPVRATDHNADAVIKLDSPAHFTTMPVVRGRGGALWSIAAGANPTIQPEVRYAVKSADQSVASSTTVVDATDLSLPVIADGVYEVDLYLITTASQAGDVRLAFSTPTGSTMNWTPNGLSTGATSSGGSISRSVVLDPSTESAVGGVGSGTSTVAMIRGNLTAGADGVLTVRFAQFVSDATATVVKAGSRLRLDRVR